MRVIEVSRVLVDAEIKGFKPHHVIDILIGSETIRLNELEAGALLNNLYLTLNPIRRFAL